MTCLPNLGLKTKLLSLLKGIHQLASNKFQVTATLETSAQLPNRPQQGLALLPMEIILEIFRWLDVRGAIHLAQVSRYFHEVFKDIAVRRNMLARLQNIPRVLVFDELSDSSTLSFSALLKATFRSELLYWKWNNHGPRPVLHENIRLKFAGFWGLFCSSDQFAVMPTNTELLDGLHIINARHTSEPAIKRPYGKPTLHPSYQHGTHFATLRLQAREPQSVFYLAPISCKCASPDEVFCKPISKFDFPRDWVLIEQILDIENKRIYALFSLPSDNRVRVFIVLDWRNTQSISFDTGLEYHPGSTASSLRLSHDGERFDVFTDRSGPWCLKTYSLAQIMQRAAPYPEVIESGHAHILPTREIALDFDPWPNPPLTNSFSILRLYKYWTIPQPSQFPHSNNPHFSHVHLYRINTYSRNFDWRVSQYYSDASGAPCSRRSCWDMDDFGRAEVIGNYGHSHCRLLMSVAFTHLAWVVRYPVTKLGRTRWRRELKLVAFPECKMSSDIGGPDSDMERVISNTLNIPSRVLDRAWNVYLEPTLASVFIITLENDLHRFQYA